MSVDVVGVPAKVQAFATNVFAAELSLYSIVLVQLSTPAGLNLIATEPVVLCVPTIYKLLVSVVTSLISVTLPIVFLPLNFACS